MKSSGISVLVIDDEPAVNKTIEMCLRRVASHIHTTTDAKEGLKLARSIAPDVILCDANMPGLTGAQVISSLKSDAETAHIPVVLMTGIADAGMFSHIQWTNFLSKPFGPKELREAIESAVAKSRAAGELPDAKS